MNREAAIREIKQQWHTIAPMFLERAKEKANREESFVCPICGHGKGGDGLTRNPKSKDGTGLHCFGCGWSGDIIDLYMKAHGYSFSEAVEMMAGVLDISIDPYQPQDAPKPAAAMEARTDDQSTEETPKGAAADYISYYRECMRHLKEPVAREYLQQRGISYDTAIAYWIGYDPAADPANAAGLIGEGYRPHPCPRIIIPTCAGHYVGRSIDPNTDKRFMKVNPKNSTPGIFNWKALYAQEVREVFVTEGVFDALSVIEAGAAAVALNSTSNRDQLLKMLENRRTEATLILCLDNDDAGRKAEAELHEGLQRLNIDHVSADICCGHKDPNEALTADREAFVAAVNAASGKASVRPDNTALYIDTLMHGEIEKFSKDISTGFTNIDEVSGGGLFAGLYVLAASPSIGKTTFTLQMADQIAAAGHDVLFFSLEQSRLELVSKSITRKAAQLDDNSFVTSIAIRKGGYPETVRKAAAAYKKEVADRISIIERNFSCNVSYIGDYIRKYIKRTGTRPVVFIDYLQILQPETDKKRQTTKEAIDSSVIELRRISRAEEITIVAISSVNRAGYLTPIDFESLKESGGIEFSADVVWGLQLQCLAEPLFDEKERLKQKRDRVNAAKREIPRKIELSCLKNRFGRSNYGCYFDYLPQYDLFLDKGKRCDEEESTVQQRTVKRY